MSIADSMRLAWYPGLTDAVERRNVATHALLSSGANTIVGADHTEFRLYVGNPRDAGANFAHEADRFAAASFESVLTGGRNHAFPRSTAWLVIRCYYAAFFAFHALLRIGGVACTRVTASSLANVNREAASLYGRTNPYQAGLYRVTLASDLRTIVCSRLDPSLGGTHEILWSLLQQYLSELVQKLLSIPGTDHQEMVVLVDSFQTALAAKGGAQWFAKLRNNINYSHTNGAWFPYRGSTTDYDRLSRTIDEWPLPPSPLGSEPDELTQFGRACRFLVSTCATTVRDLNFRSVSRSPFRASSGLLLRGV